VRKLQFVVSVPLVLACGVQAQTTHVEARCSKAANAFTNYDFMSINERLVESTTVTNPTKRDTPRLDITLDNRALATSELTFSAPAAGMRTGRLRGLWPRRRRTKSQFLDIGAGVNSAPTRDPLAPIGLHPESRMDP